MAKESRRKRKAILGRKLGMTQVFSEEGRWIPVTVIQAGPCTVLQVKAPETDGYASFQLGFDDTRKKRKNPQQAYLNAINVGPKRFVHEVPYVDPADLELGPGRREEKAEEGTAEKAEEGTAEKAEEGTAEKAEEGTAALSDTSEGAGPAPEPGSISEPLGTKAEAPEKEEKKEKKEKKESPREIARRENRKLLGAVLRVSAFKSIPRIDVRGVTKGRGFAGVIRRYHFNAGPKSHGSKNIREPGSTGMHTDPGRVIKGKRMPGHMGAVKRKARNLTVVGIQEDDNLILVKGCVPGRNGGYLYIEESLR